jgi:hypothetical protein
MLQNVYKGEAWSGACCVAKCSSEIRVQWDVHDTQMEHHHYRAHGRSSAQEWYFETREGPVNSHHTHQIHRDEIRRQLDRKYALFVV